MVLPQSPIPGFSLKDEDAQGQEREVSGALNRRPRMGRELGGYLVQGPHLSEEKNQGKRERNRRVIGGTGKP